MQVAWQHMAASRDHTVALLAALTSDRAHECIYVAYVRARQRKIRTKGEYQKRTCNMGKGRDNPKKGGSVNVGIAIDYEFRKMSWDKALSSTST
jgi:hypothetical protein